MRSIGYKREISIYHFINYGRSDLTKYLSDLGMTSTFICLDLEDSIQDIFHPQKTSELKKEARNSIKKIFQSDGFSRLNWSLRLNSFHSDEIKADIEMLKDLSHSVKIKSLMLPKAEDSNQIKNLLRILENSKIEISEIIPIIETRNGFENIDAITGLEDSRFKKIVFGHCDFNYDNNIFPFFHQSSEEYWHWIKKISSTAKLSDKEFINSAYLKLNDNSGFHSMLSKLAEICNCNFGQVALNYKQAEICRNFKSDKKELNGFDKDLARKDILIYAENIVRNFENNNLSKGFSIAGDIKELISPHEYKAAKNYLKMQNGN